MSGQQLGTPLLSTPDPHACCTVLFNLLHNWSCCCCRHRRRGGRPRRPPSAPTPSRPYRLRPQRGPRAHRRLLTALPGPLHAATVPGVHTVNMAVCVFRYRYGTCLRHALGHAGQRASVQLLGRLHPRVCHVAWRCRIWLSWPAGSCLVPNETRTAACYLCHEHPVP